MTEYRDFETDQYRLRFIKESEGWICRLDPHVMEMIETSVTHRKAEPVAWTSQDVLDADHIIKAVVRREQDEQHTIPLYTHPVKELTDEEIANTWDDVRKDATLKSSMKDIQDFARAILRKAQEK